MLLHPELDKGLHKIYEPKTTIDDVFKGYDITFVTNENGEPVLLFLASASPLASLLASATRAPSSASRAARPSYRATGTIRAKSWARAQYLLC